MTVRRDRQAGLPYLVGHVELFGVLLESEEDEKEERDDPEDEERAQGEPNPTPVTPQKRAEKAVESSSSSCNVAALAIVQLTSWPARLALVERACSTGSCHMI